MSTLGMEGESMYPAEAVRASRSNRERAVLLEIEKTMRYLVRSRSFSPLSETEFRTVRSLLDKLDEARSGGGSRRDTTG